MPYVLLRRMPALALVLGLVVWLLALAAPAARAQQGTIIQIADAPYPEFNAIVNEAGDVLYVGQVSRNELFLYTAADGATTQLTFDSRTINGHAFNDHSDAAWQWHDGSMWQIQVYNGETGQVTTVSVPGAQNAWPVLSNSRHVFWLHTTEFTVTGVTDVYRYDIVTGQVENLTGAEGNRPGEANWELVVNDRGDAAWRRDRRGGTWWLTFYDSDTGQVRELTARDVPQFPRGLSEDQSIVYTQQAPDSGLPHVFAYDVATDTDRDLSALAGAPGRIANVAPNRLGDVLWSHVDSTTWERHGPYLYVANGGTVEELPAVADMVRFDLNDQLEVAGNQSVDGNYEIFFYAYNSGELSRITDNADTLRDDNPLLNNEGVIVWNQYDSDARDYDLFAYVPPRANTPTGSDVTVEPVDETTGEPAPLTLTFDTVVEGGETTVTSSSNGPGAPPDFRLGSPPVYYDLTTTAVFEGSVEVCLTYDEASFRNEEKISLFHEEGGTWVDVTTLLDTGTNLVCGEVTSFSLFAAFEHNVIDVAVDIKPGGDTNPINLRSRGNVPAAVLGSAEFDVDRIDVATVTLAGAPVRTRGRGAPQMGTEDVNDDGIADLVLHFDTQALVVSAGDASATLEGRTFDDTIVRGSDAVRVR